MPYSLYCYFTVPPEHAALLPQLQALQRQLAGAGISAQLLRRRDDAHTWMEVYQGIHDCEAFRRRWQQACQQHGVAALARHEEWFQPLASGD